jgi:hypothetical protein
MTGKGTKITQGRCIKNVQNIFYNHKAKIMSGPVLAAAGDRKMNRLLYRLTRMCQELDVIIRRLNVMLLCHS